MAIDEIYQLVSNNNCKINYIYSNVKTNAYLRAEEVCYDLVLMHYNVLIRDKSTLTWKTAQKLQTKCFL